MTTLVPSHGRDYKNQKEVKAAWNAGKDFIVSDAFNRWDGKPANKDSFLKSDTLMIRYSRLMKIVNVRGNG